MALRQAMYWWLIPSVFVLPFWLVIGWIINGSNPLWLVWALLTAPIVFVVALVLALLVRARGSARLYKAVSWPDFFGLLAWQVGVVLLGFYNGGWWWLTLAVTVALGFGMLFFVLKELWNEAQPAARMFRTPSGRAFIPPAESETDAAPAASATDDVFVITEDKSTS